jgi:tetraacyldisaccharide 4'-kinase
VQRKLHDIWYGTRPAPWFLRGLAALYGCAVRLRSTAYRSRLLRAQAAGRPVIIVGNLTVGGTGKTPLVIWVCEQLQGLGLRPGIVLRGYGGTASQTHAVLPEAALLAQRTGLPVVLGRDRVAAARELVRRCVDVIVADDGLQHLRLARDLELVVMDGARGLGNGRLLPAGPLRESPSRLGNAHALIINGAHEARVPQLHGGAVPVPEFSMRLTGGRLRSLDASGQEIALASLAGRQVHAVAGIGDPARFFRLLRAAGLMLIEHPFADHHAYRREELLFADGLPLLMTEKDAVKCRLLGLHAAWYLPVSASFTPAETEALRELLQAALQRAALMHTALPPVVGSS